LNIKTSQKITQLELFNSLGIFIDKYNPDTQISLKDLSPGLYFIKIYTNHLVCTKKILKLP
jgi:hypothetical protein